MFPIRPRLQVAVHRSQVSAAEKPVRLVVFVVGRKHFHTLVFGLRLQIPGNIGALNLPRQQLRQAGEILRRPDPFQFIEIRVFAAPMLALRPHEPLRFAQLAPAVLVRPRPGRHIVIRRNRPARRIPLRLALNHQIPLQPGKQPPPVHEKLFMRERHRVSINRRRREVQPNRLEIAIGRAFALGIRPAAGKQFPSMHHIRGGELAITEMPRNALPQLERPSLEIRGDLPAFRQSRHRLRGIRIVLNQRFAIRVVLHQVRPGADPNAVAFIERHGVGNPDAGDLGGRRRSRRFRRHGHRRRNRRRRRLNLRTRARRADGRGRGCRRRPLRRRRSRRRGSSRRLRRRRRRCSRRVIPAARHDHRRQHGDHP